jgi:hypothetical protein
MERVCTIYIPETGVAWTGSMMEDHQVLIDGYILGFWYHGGGNEMLQVSVSTNHYEAGLHDVSNVLKRELEQFKAGRGRYDSVPPYTLKLERIFGPAVLRDRSGPKVDGWPDTNAFSLMTRPSRLKAVSVEGTNTVVAIEFGANMLAKIALAKDVRPIWATTNGVSIGSIPTNTVLKWDFVTNYPVLRVIY